MGFSRPHVCLAIAAAMTVSCTGEIADPASTAGEPGSVRRDTNDVCVPGYTGLRRLNKREYANTLRDLLGVPASVGDALPDDPLSGGFDTHAVALAVTPELYERFIDVAETAVEQALTERYDALVPCTPAANDFDDACVGDVITTFAERAYRRPLTEEDLAELRALHADASTETGDLRETLVWVFAGIVASPSVLYRPSSAKDAYALATRLSYFLWSSTPDDALLERAAAGDLVDEAVLRGEVERMLRDARARDFTRELALQWLDLRGLENKVFDGTAYPDFDPVLLGHMLDETAELVHQALAGGGDPREVLTATHGYVTPELAAHYGADAAPDADGRVALPADQRRGVLTQGAILAATAHPDRTSIPARGMWVMANLLCIAPPPPPPDDIDTSVVDAPGEMTQRERFERHRSDPSCAGCHATMDELGFGLEHYDATGAFRTDDHGLDIDAHGVLPDGRTFDGAVELADLLASDEDDTFTRCLSENLLAYAIGRIVTRGDHCELDEIVDEPGLSASELLVRIVASDAFRDVEAPEVTP